MRISDWSSDVCSSDLIACAAIQRDGEGHRSACRPKAVPLCLSWACHSLHVDAGLYPDALRLSQPSVDPDRGDRPWNCYRGGTQAEIGRASGGERVWQKVWITGIE